MFCMASRMLCHIKYGPSFIFRNFEKITDVGMKRIYIYTVLAALSLLPSGVLRAQNTEFDDYARKSKQEYEDFVKQKNDEYAKFLQEYADAFEAWKKAYLGILEDEKKTVELMASDDGIAAEPLPGGPEAVPAVSSVADELKAIEADIDAVTMAEPEDILPSLSSSADSVVRLQEAATALRDIVSEISGQPQDDAPDSYRPQDVKGEIVISLPSLSDIPKGDAGRETEIVMGSSTDIDTDDFEAYNEPETVTAADATAEVSLPSVETLPADAPSEAAADASLSVPSGKPTDYVRISSPFGTRVHPITRKRHTHKGIDLAAPKMTPIYATADGDVTFAKWNGGYGNFVKINHGNGYKTAYAHMHKIAVEKGAHVSKGDLIGYVGTTGRSTGNHLHYEVYYQDKLIDPATTL